MNLSKRKTKKTEKKTKNKPVKVNVLGSYRGGPAQTEDSSRRVGAPLFLAWSAPLGNSLVSPVSAD